MQAHPADAITIETPDHIEFHYELAGVASRICAAVLDALLQLLLLIALLIVFVAVTMWSPSELLGDPTLGSLSGWGVAFVLLGAFCVLWVYPILFELFMDGRTPGKRAIGIRVIQDDGTALTPASVLVRNVLRVADFLPAVYFVGLVVMLCNGRYKRVGDFAAGTVVIRESVEVQPNAIVDWRGLQRADEEESVAEIRRAGVHRLSADEIRVVESFLSRSRELSDDARVRLAAKLAGPLRQRLGVQSGDPEQFLRLVLIAYHAAEEHEGSPA
jgi:uncharacterized RDD family membrane protein YckC